MLENSKAYDTLGLLKILKDFLNMGMVTQICIKDIRIVNKSWIYLRILLSMEQNIQIVTSLARLHNSIYQCKIIFPIPQHYLRGVNQELVYHKSLERPIRLQLRWTRYRWWIKFMQTCPIAVKLQLMGRSDILPLLGNRNNRSNNPRCTRLSKSKQVIGEGIQLKIKNPQ